MSDRTFSLSGRQGEPLLSQFIATGRDAVYRKIERGSDFSVSVWPGVSQVFKD
jgi:hypothetical protein